MKYYQIFKKKDNMIHHLIISLIKIMILSILINKKKTIISIRILTMNIHNKRNIKKVQT